MMFLIFLVPAVLLSIRDLHPAIRDGKRLYVFAYLVLTTAALVLWTLLYRGVPLTSPNTFIKQLIDMFVATR